MENNHIAYVSSFEELSSFRFSNSVNALGWNRELEGDFSEIVSQLNLVSDITDVSVADLLELKLSDKGQKARSIILEDIKALTKIGAQPVLNLIKSYERDHALDFITTDVYSFHVDQSPVPTTTYLCTYHGDCSEILPNQDAEKLVDVSEIRDQLLSIYDGALDGFDDFLKEYYFDLHYRAKTTQNIIKLKSGALWRLSVLHPQQEVQPCIHRAPLETDGQIRLMLIC